MIARLPLLVVAIVLGAVTLFAGVVRLSDPVAIHPWEPAIAMEAVRLNAGVPVYETGHATHMYGPLLTAALAGIFRLTGLNLLAARIVFSVAAVALAALLAAIFIRREERSWRVLAFLLFLAVSFRTNLVFFTAQPDCVATLCGVSALYLWATRERATWRGFVSLALFVTGMLFKQTAAAFALVPIIYSLGWRRRFADWGAALLPACSVFAVLAVIYFCRPQMFHAIVTVPASIKVNAGRIPVMSLYLLGTFPIFLLGLLGLVRSAWDERVRWALASLVVLVPVSIWTMAKSGGSYNSLLYAYLAMTALFVTRFETIVNWTRSLPATRGFAALSALALAILLSVLVQFDFDLRLLSVRHGNDHYREVVEMARHLDGRVISPQDPTIAYRVNGYIGRSLFFELDTHAVNGNWPEELPDSADEELAQSKYVIEFDGYVPTPVFTRGLEKNHFRAVQDFPPGGRGSVYTVWRKD